jgi:hypothetical protein
VRRFHLVSVFLVFVLGASAPAFSQSAAARQSQHLYLDRAKAQGCISKASLYHCVDERMQANT